MTLANVPFFDMDKEPDQAREVGPTFQLRGQLFHCIPEAPPSALNQILTMTARNPGGGRVYSAPDVIGFIQAVLMEQERVPIDGAAEVEGVVADDQYEMQPTDDVQRFNAIIEDKENTIPLSKLVKLALDLVAHYSKRPT